MIYEEKVVLARNGDKDAFYCLIDSKKEMLYRIAFTYTKDKENALEIVSETVLKAFISVRKLRCPEFFSTWLVRIHINCCLDFVKKNKRTVQLNENLGHTSVKNTDYDELMDLRFSMEKLDPKLKTIIILKYFNDFTVNEVSQILNCPLGTVKTNLNKALKQLRLEMKEDIENVKY